MSWLLQDEPSYKPSVPETEIDTAPTNIKVTEDDASVAVDPVLEKFRRVTTEKYLLEDELQKIKSSVKTTEILDSLIKPYAKRAFIFMCVYCSIVAVMLLLHGFGIQDFKLPPSVLNFLVGSTATTVIGLVGMVLTGVFVGARRPRI